MRYFRASARCLEGLLPLAPQRGEASACELKGHSLDCLRERHGRETAHLSCGRGAIKICDRRGLILSPRASQLLFSGPFACAIPVSHRRGNGIIVRFDAVVDFSRIVVVIGCTCTRSWEHVVGCKMLGSVGTGCRLDANSHDASKVDYCADTAYSSIADSLR